MYLLSPGAKRAQIADGQAVRNFRRISRHVDERSNMIGSRLARRIDGKQLGILTRERSVVELRRVAINAALEQRTFGSWIDDRCTQSRQIAQGAFDNVDA